MSEETAVAEAETVETVDVTTEHAKTDRQPNIRDPRDYNLELRKENARLRKTLDEQAAAKAEELANQKLESLRAETEEKARKDAERLIEKRLSEMQEQAKARAIKLELKAAAVKAGVIDFDDAYAIMRGYLDKIEMGDDGEVSNADALIADLKERKPHLFVGVTTTSTAQTPRQDRNPPPAKAALAMSVEEYAKAKAALGRL